MADVSHPPSVATPGVAVLDVHGRVVSWSAAAERLTGWPSHDIEGHIFPLTNARHSDPFSDGFLSDLSASSLDGFTVRADDPQGTSHLFHAWSSPFQHDHFIVTFIPEDPTASLAADRLLRLQELTRELGTAKSVEQVAGILIEKGLSLLGASAGSVALLGEGGQDVYLVGSSGYPEVIRNEWERFPLSAEAPICDAIRSGEPVWLNSRAEWASLYPHLAERYPETPYTVAAAVPLRVNGHILGSLGLSYANDRGFSDDEKAFITTLARQCAQAMDRIRMHEARRRAQAEKEAAVTELALFPEENPNPILRIAVNGEVLYANPMAQALEATLEREAQTKRFLPRLREEAEKALANKTRSEIEVVCAEGRVYSFDCVPFPERAYANLYGRDITARKRSEEAQRLSEEKFAKAFASHPAAITLTGLNDGRFLEVNDTWVEIMGYRREEAIGSTAQALRIWPDAEDRAAFVEELRRMGSLRHWERPLRKKSGEIIMGLLSAEVLTVGGEPLILTTFLDITDRKQSEQALRLSEQKFARAFAANPAAMSLTRLDDGLFLEVNETWVEMMGYSRKEAIGNTASALQLWADPEARARYVEELQRAGSMRNREQRFRRKSGEVFTALVSVEILTVGSEQLTLLTFLDITERKRAEEALKESEERFRTLADNISQLAWMADASGKLTWFNKRWYEYTGLTEEDTRHYDRNRVQHPEHSARVLEHWRKSLTSGEPWEDTYPIRRWDGQFRWFLSRAVPVRDENGTIVRWFGTNTDITERLEVDEELRRSEEQLRLATLAARIGVWSWVPGTSDVVVSANWRALFGVAPDQPVTFETWRDAVHPDDREHAVTELNAASEEHREFNTEYRVLLPDGSVRWVADRGRATYDVLGRPIRMAGVNLDITEQKRTEEYIRDLNEALRERNAELDAERERWRSAIEGIADEVWICDAQGRMSLMNLPAVTHMGLDEFADRFLDEVTSDVEILWPDGTVRPIEDAPLLRSLEGEIVRGEEIMRHRRTGRTRYRHFSSAPTRDASGAVTGAVAIVRDITDEKLTQEALRRREATLAQAGMMAHLGAWEIVLQKGGDLATGALHWSDEVYCIYGYESGAVNPTRSLFFQHVHPDDRERVTATMEIAIAQRAPYEIEHRIVRSDGEERILLERAVIAFDERDQPRHILGAVQDITERKHLEREIQARAEALARADQEKDEFLLMLAHELRNPLGAIGNAAALIEMKAEGHDFLRKPVEILNRQVKHTARLVDDLLDISRISRGKMELRRELVDLSEVARRAAETADPQMEAHHHDFTVSVPSSPLWIEGDQARLEQIIGNLLSNAAKYTDPGGCISLSLTREGRHGVVRVTDTGRGIEAEMLPRVFDLFVQEDRSLARSKGGLGVGLTLVRRLTEMHSGTAEVHSEGSGRGSEFVVRLPLLETEEPEQASPPALPAATGKRRILLVEDNVDAAVALGDILDSWGHEVTVVHDGPTALVAAAEKVPDVILLDIGLPVMDGYEVARALRQEPAAAGSLIVALTGYGQEADQRRSRDAGFDLHLVKPVDMQQLQGVLATTA